MCVCVCVCVSTTRRGSRVRRTAVVILDLSVFLRVFLDRSARDDYFRLLRMRAIKKTFVGCAKSIIIQVTLPKFVIW